MSVIHSREMAVINKVYNSFETAVDDIPDGAVIMMPGILKLRRFAP